jgi:hypothetical protein
MKQRDDRADESDPGRDLEEDAEVELETGRGLHAEAQVICPYCGEAVEITLDPGGGLIQEYVEDCQVCCRPWQVHVRYEASGGAEVWIEEAQ